MRRDGTSTILRWLDQDMELYRRDPTDAEAVAGLASWAFSVGEGVIAELRHEIEDWEKAMVQWRDSLTWCEEDRLLLVQAMKDVLSGRDPLEVVGELPAALRAAVTSKGE